jgi:hypothetical protein
MIRTIKCGFENGTLNSESSCNKLEKPTYLTECVNRVDCLKYSRSLYNINEEQAPTSNAAGRVHYSSWSKCSAKCGPGNRTRSFSCKSARDEQIDLPMSYCNTDLLESLIRSCELANCTYRMVQKWSKV